jgi:pimeloyl-ACP methyl ester carboxylesterase
MNLYVVERGQGPTVVLLHGLMATSDMFRWLAEPLAERFHLIIPDLPGHGRSADVSGPYTVEAMTAWVAAELESRGVREAHVMGYSHGGTVAQRLALDAPHLVRSLALVATYAHNTATRRERVEGWLAPRLVRALGMRRFANIVARPGLGGGPPMPPDQIAWMREMLSGNGTAAMAQAAAELSGFDSRPWLGRLRVPTLVVCGEVDSAVPVHHVRMLTEGIAGSRSVTVPGAGHTLVWTHRDQLAQILTTWWSDISAEAGAGA